MKDNNSASMLTLIFNVAIWYILTIISALYSKIYLQNYGDSIILTMVSFLCGTCLVPFFMTYNEVVEFIKGDTVKTVSMFHIGLTFLTNIAIKYTSVAFTYMIKASEPICVALLLTFVTGRTWSTRMYSILFLIFIGVSITVFGELNASFLGILSVSISILSAGSRNVIFNQTNTSSSSSSQSSQHSASKFFKSYLIICLVSFIFFLPITVFNQLLHVSNSEIGFFKSYLSKSLFYGGFFHFLFNLFSFYVLKSTSTVTHAIINVMRRIVTILASLVYFRNPLTFLQFIGIFVSNLGIMLYVKFKNYESDNTTAPTASVNTSVANLIYMKRKKLLIILLTILIYSFGVFEMYQINGTADDSNPSTIPIDADLNAELLKLNADFNIPSDVDQNAIANTLTAIDHRLVCINKIKSQIIDDYKRIFGDATVTAHVMSIPMSKSYDDLFIWLGEQALLNGLNQTLGVTCETNFTSCTDISNIVKINTNDVIIVSGKKALRHRQRIFRNEILQKFPKNKILFMSPSNIHMKNATIALEDKELFQAHKDLHLIVNRQDLYQFSQGFFSHTKSYLIPHVTFTMFNMVSAAMMSKRRKAKYDVIVFLDEKRLAYDAAMNGSLSLLTNATQRRYSHYVTNFNEQKFDGESIEHFFTRGQNVLSSVVSLLGKGRIVITNNLHVSVLCVHMDKPQVYYDSNNNDQLLDFTYEYAFKGKAECEYNNLRMKHAVDLRDAIKITVNMLDNNIVV